MRCSNHYWIAAPTRRSCASPTRRAATGGFCWPPLSASLRGVLLARAIRHCVFGVDTDVNAIRLCRALLARAAGCNVEALTKIRKADGLDAWHGATFDAVVGNPPFRNAIEGKRRHYEPHPLVGGTADLAYRFLVRAAELVKPGGIVAMIQPRPMLNAACLERFRRDMPNSLRPNLIFAPDHSRLFSGAGICMRNRARATADLPGEPRS